MEEMPAISCSVIFNWLFGSFANSLSRHDQLGLQRRSPSPDFLPGMNKARNGRASPRISPVSQAQVKGKQQVVEIYLPPDSFLLPQK